MEIRLDRVIRVHWRGQQACSLIVRDNRLYMIRTGVLGDVVDQKPTNIEPVGMSADPIPDPIVSIATEAMMHPLNKVIYGVTRRRLKGGEARLSEIPLDELANGRLSASVALSEIINVRISTENQFMMSHPIPRMKIKTTGKETYTLRFPQASAEEIEQWVSILRPQSQ